MGLGISLFMIAVGAILTWAVTTTVAGVSLEALGVILMMFGAVGLIVGVVAASRSGRRAPGMRR